MKIKGTCKRDGREFMVEQVVASGGECPWDGEPFQSDYAVTLVNALREAEEAGSKLEQALEQVADLRPEFTLQSGSVLGSLKTSIERLEQNLIVQG
ncbi:MAG: hypothetical protein ACXWYJ_09310 [Actinomycetota bacterium]